MTYEMERNLFVGITYFRFQPAEVHTNDIRKYRLTLYVCRYEKLL